MHRLGDNVDTDAMLPGRYLALREPAALGAHCLEDLDPEFRTRVKPATFWWPEETSAAARRANMP